ncbi:hypothetical protein [Mesorhizobium sp. CAU 1741]|uniref:hypothetical protein n=1 Tax=Mesorhizobium sp. CAU 1741 TaxID=3140366 RepID=UPI00325A4F81
MIAAFARTFDNLFGRGEAAVTVPPLDGAFRPNRMLDEAGSRAALEGVDCLATHGDTLVASAGRVLMELGKDGHWVQRQDFGTSIVCIASLGADGLATALADGEIVIVGGPRAGQSYRIDSKATCITAMTSRNGELIVANGSATNAPGDWQKDLLERNASGSIWRIDLESGASSCIDDGLAWPAGLAIDGDVLVVAEAWRHQLVRFDPERPSSRKVVLADLPAYPGRIAPAADGFWLAMFAPRSQLVEFVLREPSYRRRMMAEVPQPYWVAPRLRSGRSFYESLQGGGVKHLGMLKPWAPTMSAGLCVRLDRAFQPRSSLQSRADGSTHGVTSAIEHQRRLFVAARGDGVIVSLPIDTIATDRGGSR